MATAAQYLKLNPSEVALFDHLFSLVEDRGTGVATGPQVSSLFLTSGLPRPTLATIWNIASAGKGGKLDKDGFFIGCKLVAIAQQNLPVSKDSLFHHRDVPLPMFQENAQHHYPRDPQTSLIPPQNGTQQIAAINFAMPGIMVQANRMPAMPSLSPMMASVPLQENFVPFQSSLQQQHQQQQQQQQPMQLQHQQQQQQQPSGAVALSNQEARTIPSNVAIAAAQQPASIAEYSEVSASSLSAALQSSQSRSVGPSSASNSRRSSLQAESIWDVTFEKRETYLRYFDQADADKDGFVNGREAKTFFTMSKLSSAVLRDIWLLSDIDQDNKLNKEEFTIAMHLTMAVRMSGVPVPSQLPEPLLQYYNRQMQQSSSMTASAASSSVDPRILSMSSSSMMIQPTLQAPSFTVSSAVPTHTSVSALSSAPDTDRSVERADYKRQAASSRAQIEEQKVAIQGYQSRVPDYDDELQNLKAEAKIAEDTLATLTAERRQHQAAFEKIRAEIATAKSSLQAVNEKVDEEQRSIKHYIEQVAQGTSKLDELRQDRNQLQKSVDDLKQQVQDKELAVVCIEQEIEDVQRQIDHLNEVSSYQMQILSKVSSHHDKKENDLSELLATKARLDHAKSTASVMSSASAPISPVRSSVIVDPVWIAPSFSNNTAVSSFSSSIVQEEFTFPEFNDEEFKKSPLKSAPVVTASIPSFDLASNSQTSSEVPIHSTTDSYKFSSESISQKQNFSLENESSAFKWGTESSKGLLDQSISSGVLETNPFEEDDWNAPLQTTLEPTLAPDIPQSVSSQAPNIDPMAWPVPDFGISSVSDARDWAQF